MEDSRRRAVLLELAVQLRSRGSWCGETHIQKTAFFLQELTRVPLGFEFVLYKYGPYSFELREEVLTMLAEGFLAILPNPVPYGPTLAPGPSAEELRPLFPEDYRIHVNFVTESLGTMRVVQLERIATALYVALKEGPRLRPDQHARSINALKPHISIDEAREAVSQLANIVEQAPTLPIHS